MTKVLATVEVDIDLSKIDSISLASELIKRRGENISNESLITLLNIFNLKIFKNKEKIIISNLKK